MDGRICRDEHMYVNRPYGAMLPVLKAPTSCGPTHMGKPALDGNLVLRTHSPDKLQANTYPSETLKRASAW